MRLSNNFTFMLVQIPPEELELERLEKRYCTLANNLKNMIQQYSLATHKVKHGSFQGALTRHTREIVEASKKMVAESISQSDGLKIILEEAKKLGVNHPILTAAQKCCGVIAAIDALIIQMGCYKPPYYALSHK